MPLLAIAKRRMGVAMGSAPLIADSAETMLCALLSLILLIGLLPQRHRWMVVVRSGRGPRDRRLGIPRARGSMERRVARS